MGVTWSSYKEKRKEKKEVKRFVNSFIGFVSRKTKKLEHASYAMKRKCEMRKGVNRNLV